MNEYDPTGRSANDLGAKLDAGKVRVGLMCSGFPRALYAVSEVSTYGATKYSDGGWQHVPNGRERYTDAMTRHLLEEMKGKIIDKDSGMYHAAQVAWNALARLELMLREMECQNDHSEHQRVKSDQHCGNYSYVLGSDQTRSNAIIIPANSAEQSSLVLKEEKYL